MTKYCILSAAGNYNTNVNLNNIIFTIRDIKWYAPLVTLSARDNQKLWKLLAKDLKDQFIGMNMKKSENKNTTNEYRYFLDSNFVRVNRLFVLVYTNQDKNAKKIKTWRYYLPKGIIGSCNKIINEKNFMIHQLIQT